MDTRDAFLALGEEITKLLTERDELKSKVVAAYHAMRKEADRRSAMDSFFNAPEEAAPPTERAPNKRRHCGGCRTPWRVECFYTDAGGTDAVPGRWR